MNTKLQKIYEERAKFYNLELSTFESEGATVLEVESLRNENYFTIAEFDKHLVIRVDPEMELLFDKTMTSGKSPKELLNIIEAHYKNLGRTLSKTFCFYYYLKDEKLNVESDLMIERITNSNSGKLDVFLDGLSEEEIDLADIELDNLDPVIFGGFVQGNMKGYVSHRYPNGHTGLADIGIVIDQAYRGKRFGKAMLVHEVNWCLRNEIIPMYVLLDSNESSKGLVESLGFEKICDLYMLE